MKKTYNAPLTEVVKIQGGEMLQVLSKVGVGGEYTGGAGGIQSNDDDYEGFDPSLW